MIELKGDNTSLLTIKRQNKRAFYIFYDHLLKNVTWGFFQCGLHLVYVDVLGTPYVTHYGGRLLGSACAKSYNIPRARSPNPRFPLNVVKATYGDSLHNGLKSAKKDIE
ncbi:MAG: hypothetical protein J6V89_01375 [Acetobacter sp.]|nr:hypothetical protein [Acetobacter sp.]MBO7072164.1 hypothetical protein [Acetobacter sp.]